MGARSALSKVGTLRPRSRVDAAGEVPQGTFALAEYAAVVAEQRMARFGRDSAWRTMATLGALDETDTARSPC